jgi:hypothetical protein
MNPCLDVSDEWVRRTFELLGNESLSEAQIESVVLGMVEDTVVARRLIDWVPEVTAMVLVRHVANVRLPDEFSARRADGHWIRIPMSREPVVRLAVEMASMLFHSDERPRAIRIASRSSTMNTVNRALHEGNSLGDLDGAELSGPALIGIAAEVYVPPAPSLFARLFRR